MSKAGRCNTAIAISALALQIVGHLVEILDQPAQFVRRGRRDSRVEVAACDPTGRTGQPVDRIGNALGQKGARLICTDETRRTREEMGAELYNRLGYFEKGIESLRRLLTEKGVIDQRALDTRMAEIAKRIAEGGR